MQENLLLLIIITPPINQQVRKQIALAMKTGKFLSTKGLLLCFLYTKL